MYSKDKEEMLRYEAAERAEMDFASAVSSAELRGKEIGKAEGMKLQALETAKKMLKAGFNLRQITDFTALTEAEILQLGK